MGMRALLRVGKNSREFLNAWRVVTLLLKLPLTESTVHALLLLDQLTFPFGKMLTLFCDCFFKFLYLHLGRVCFRVELFVRFL